MDAMTITAAAAITGFSASALRFYEKAGLVVPERTDAGYRIYADDDLSRLRFIARAKRLGFTIEEIAELVPLLDQANCAAVQEQMRAHVNDRITETRRRRADLVGFLGQLQQMAAWLAAPPADGACDDRCGCTTDPTTDASDGRVGATLGPMIHRTIDAPIVCTLGAADMDDRIAAWQAVTVGGLDRHAIPGGARVELPRDTDLAALAQLIDDEQACCTFFTFTLTITIDAVLLDATAPEEGQPILDAVLGTPA